MTNDGGSEVVALMLEGAEGNEGDRGVPGRRVDDVVDAVLGPLFRPGPAPVGEEEMAAVVDALAALDGLPPLEVAYVTARVAGGLVLRDGERQVAALAVALRHRLGEG